MSFLQTEVMSEEGIAMAISGFGLNNEDQTIRRNPRRK